MLSPMSSGVDDEQLEQGEPVEDTLFTQPPVNQAINLPSWLTEAKVLEAVRGFRKEAQDYQQAFYPRIEENWKLYENKPSFGYGDLAEILPLPASIVDTQQARAMGSMLAQEKFGDAVPINFDNVLAPDANNKTSLVEDLINEKVRATDDFEDKMDEATKNLFVETLMIAEVKWNVKTEQILQATSQIDPITGMETVGQAEMVDYECQAPDFEPVSLRYLMWEPRCKTKLSRAAWVGRKQKVTADELRADESAGVIQNAERAITTQGQGGEGPGKDDRSDPQAKQIKNVEGKQLPSGGKEGLLDLEVWYATMSGSEGEGEEKVYQRGEFRFWMVGDVMVKFDPNPYGALKPFVMARMSRKPDQLLAQGPIDLIKGMMRNLAMNMSSLNNLVKQAACNPIFYEPTTMLDGRRTILQENDLIAVLSVDGIKRMEPPVQAIALLREQISFMIVQIREATASNEQAQGIQAEGDTTATEAQIMANSANLRTQYTANMVMATFFAELMWFYFKMFQKFGTEQNMVIHEAGVDGKPISLTIDDLVGDYTFKPILAMSQSSKNQRFQMLKGLVTELATASAQNPMLLVNEQGQPMEVDMYGFLTQQMFPLIDIFGTSKLFKPKVMPQMMPGMPGAEVQGMPPQMPAEEPMPVDIQGPAPGLV